MYRRARQFCAAARRRAILSLCQARSATAAVGLEALKSRSRAAITDRALSRAGAARRAGPKAARHRECGAGRVGRAAGRSGSHCRTSRRFTSPSALRRCRCRAALRKAWGSDDKAVLRAATAGDDYEIAFTAPRAKRAKLMAAAKAAGVPVTEIGWVMKGRGVALAERGKVSPIATKRYRATPISSRKPSVSSDLRGLAGCVPLSPFAPFSLPFRAGQPCRRKGRRSRHERGNAVPDRAHVRRREAYGLRLHFLESGHELARCVSGGPQQDSIHPGRLCPRR